MLNKASKTRKIKYHLSAFIYQRFGHFFTGYKVEREIFKESINDNKDARWSKSISLIDP